MLWDEAVLCQYVAGPLIDPSTVLRISKFVAESSHNFLVCRNAVGST